MNNMSSNLQWHSTRRGSSSAVSSTVGLVCITQNCFILPVEEQYVVHSSVFFVTLWPLQLCSASSHSLTIINGPAAPSHFSSHSPSFAFQVVNETPVKCIMNILLILMKKMTRRNLIVSKIICRLPYSRV